jgi:ribose/xylose/arabinose/galactoside ABC-type transport system permease subunit
MVNYTNSWNWFHWDWIQRKQEKIRGYGETTFSWTFQSLTLNLKTYWIVFIVFVICYIYWIFLFETEFGRIIFHWVGKVL